MNLLGIIMAALARAAIIGISFADSPYRLSELGSQVTKSPLLIATALIRM